MRNCQGTGQSPTPYGAGSLALSDLQFLMETKAQESAIEMIRRKLKFEHMLSVNPIGRSGGLAIFWTTTCRIQMTLTTKKYVGCTSV